MLALLAVFGIAAALSTACGELVAAAAASGDAAIMPENNLREIILFAFLDFLFCKCVSYFFHLTNYLFVGICIIE